ncbi:MAG: aldehyde dehydrogenase (NADP(+)), partial [Acidobacteriota bacterium]
PGALRERGEAIATGLHGSITLGAGQFCTKPGLVIIHEDEAGQAFIDRLAQLMGVEQVFTLLNEGIERSYEEGKVRLEQTREVKTLARPTLTPGPGCQTTAALYQTTAASFLANPELQDEVFGPAALVITWSTKDDLLRVIQALEGQLTASLHASSADLLDFAGVLHSLEARAGRLVFNGFPTGVEVCHAMVHGGPWPATSDGRSTSVGTRAIFRFTRQVCYQGFPDGSLPVELQNGNPTGIWRMVDGQLTQDSF